MFSGLQNKFVYKLEACNVHFPMTIKIEQGFLIINNFLGEKIPRKAKMSQTPTPVKRLVRISVLLGRREEPSASRREACGAYHER